MNVKIYYNYRSQSHTILITSSNQSTPDHYTLNRTMSLSCLTLIFALILIAELHRIIHLCIWEANITLDFTVYHHIFSTALRDRFVSELRHDCSNQLLLSFLKHALG